MILKQLDRLVDDLSLNNNSQNEILRGMILKAEDTLILAGCYDDIKEIWEKILNDVYNVAESDLLND